MSVNYDRVCRLCLSSRGELLPIFSTTSSDDSEPPVLATKIKDCVSVQISENDDLPTKICRKCMDNVNNWHIFKSVCERTQNKLESLIKKDGNQLEEVKIKSEPLFDEAYDDGVVIDGSYPDGENGGISAKIQPEGPPILASLGLTPRSDKGMDSEKEEEEEEDEEMNESGRFSNVPAMPEVSITVMRPSGETLAAKQGIQALASKDCLVCGRSYRYSHNARRHELTAHSFDRYTNKVSNNKSFAQMQPKLRPNPFNPKARLMPSHKMHLIPKPVPKLMPHKIINPPQPVLIKKGPQNNLPYPLRIKALKDLQIKKKEPQMLKTLLTSKPETLTSEIDIANSEPESPETLISEPEIASFQVETILSEPDAFDQPQGEEEAEGETEDNNQSQQYDTVDMDSENEIEIARQQENETEEDDHNADNDNEENMQQDDEHMQHDDEHMQHDDEHMHHDDENNMEGTQSETEKELEENGEHEENIEKENDVEQKHEEQEEGKEVIGEDEGENEEQEVNHEENEEDDEDMPPMSLAPVVEINEDMQTNSYNSEVNEEEEELDETADLNETEEEPVKELDPDKTYVTKTQRDFIVKYKDIIQQINTKVCLCCDREHPRRKAVIQHLQKNGHKVPKHTCYNCVVTFGHIGALLSHMRSNTCTDLWKIIYNENGITDEMVLDDEPKEAKVQYKDVFNARSYACKLCPAKFQLKQFIMKHVLDVHEDGQSRVPMICVHCGSRFKEKSLIKKHIRNGDCTVYISCDLCSEKFSNMQKFNDHALAVHAGNFDQSDNQSKCVDGRLTDCPICGKKNSNYPNLVKHLKIIHNEEKPHYCKHCDAKFEQIADLNQHIYMGHSDRGMSLSSEPDMSLVKEEAEEYHYSCTECNAIFETVDAWTDHQVAEHNQVAHHCDQCDKKFLRPSELAEHKNTHLRVKFYPCNVCTNSYSTPQKLSEHVQQAHPGAGSALPTMENEFFCDICVRSFKSRQAYSNHMRIHARVPTHNRKPGDPKGFSPQIIGKPIKQFPAIQTNFVYKPNCNVPNAPYSCDICGKGFMHKKNIWKHKKVLHADILNDRNDSEENTMQASTEEDDYNVDENGALLSTPQFNSFNFASFTNNAQQQPQEDPMPFSCELCFKRFPLRSSLWKHKRAKHGIINASAGGEAMTPASVGESSSRSSCTICKITFSDKKSYYRHRKNVHKSATQMCKICGKPLNSTLELYEHLKAAHARELLGYNASQGTSSKSQDMKQELEVDYENDQDSIDPSVDYQARYPCDTCGKQFVGLLALQNHQCINQVQSQPQTFDCEICHKSYTSIAALKSHRGWHLRSPDGKAAANNSGLWMPHNKVTSKVSKHEIVDPVQLARVSHSAPAASPAATVAAKRRLPPEVEVTVVNPNKKLRSDDSIDLEQTGALEDRYCTICDKEFTKRAAYQRHMEEVHQPNSVFCPVCDKSFTRKSTLIVHMKKHYEGGQGSSSTQAEDEVACDVCGSHFESEAALRSHKARHHAEDESEESEDEGLVAAPQPGEFTCAQCGDGVATPRDLIAHRTMHATPTKFFCNICKVYFARALDLSSHTRARHADNEKVFFPCAMCDRFYMNKKSLQRHIETAH